MTMSPTDFAATMSTIPTLLPAKVGTIFEPFGFEIFYHLFEVLKTDVHRRFGIASIFNSLIFPKNVFSRVLAINNEFFNINNVTEATLYEFRNTVEVLASIYTTAMFEYFEKQPAPTVYGNCFLSIQMPKKFMTRERMNNYVQLQQKFPSGKCFDTMAMVRTNYLYCDQMNVYTWEFFGKYVYVINTKSIENLLYITNVADDAERDQDSFSTKRPFPFNYILGRRVINVYMTSVPHITAMHEVLHAFIYNNYEKSFADQVANGENWSPKQRAIYNTRRVNLSSASAGGFVPVDERTFAAQMQQ